MNFWNQDVETLNLSKLKELQLKNLKRLVTYVYTKNQMYNKKLKEADVRPEDIKKLDDIKKIPFLTKDELRNYYPFGLLCVDLGDCIEVHASSGTTGKPVVVPYTKNDVKIWSEVMARALWANGLRKSDVMQNAYGYGLFTGAHGFEKGAQKIGALVIPTSSGNTRRQITVMKDFGVTALACTPSYSLYIAEVAKEMGLSPKNDFKLRLGLFGAESWSDEMKNKIETIWGIKAKEHYGLTEIIGPGVITECNENRLHINADHFLPEIIDPKTGEQLEPGNEGELVFTTLTKEGLPVLRFRTKDLAGYTEEGCECGRTLPVQTRIKGRSDDMMKVKGVIVFPSQIEAAIMGVSGSSENYQIIKKKQNDITTLSIRLEPTEERYREGDLDKLAITIEQEIFTILNLKIPVEIKKPNSLPRSEGKAKRIIEE